LLLVLEAAEQLSMDRDESIRDEYPEGSDEFIEGMERLQRLDAAIKAVRDFTRVRYPVAEYDRPQGAPPADAWFWSDGDRWVAVVAEHERATWWGFGADDVPASRPERWEYPITETPPSGFLVWCDTAGNVRYEEIQ
jgi:hypothetical protein